MSLTDKEIAQRLLKKSSGVAETNYPLDVRGIKEEAIPTYSVVTPNAIWAEADNIPQTPPVLSDGGESGVVKYYEKLQLVITDAGTEVAFKSSLGEFEDAIDSRFGFGYNFKIYGGAGGATQIFKGDWLVDPESGVITFYQPGDAEETINSSNPPYVTFYKYIGEKGIPSGGSSGINVKDPVALSTTSELDNTADYDIGISGFTTLPSSVDGVTSFNSGDRILVKDQTNEIQNGIYAVDGTTLIRATDHDGSPVNEVGVNDYVFTYSGNTLQATSWVLSGTDATDSDSIIVGQDTQTWSLFSQAKEYTASEQGIKLNQSEFYIDLNEVGAYGSGLEQSTQGLRVDETLLTQISGNTEAIIDLAQIVSEIEPLEEANAGSGLTYIASGATTPATLNVEVDGSTIIIKDNVLYSTSDFVEALASVNTTIDVEEIMTLTHDPMGPVYVMVNGVEYNVDNINGTGDSDTTPFYFDTGVPSQGSKLLFNRVYADFDLILNVDFTRVNYSINMADLLP